MSTLERFSPKNRRVNFSQNLYPVEGKSIQRNRVYRPILRLFDPPIDLGIYTGRKGEEQKKEERRLSNAEQQEEQETEIWSF